MLPSSVSRTARGLLEDFLLHEMLEAALFGHDGVPGDVLQAGGYGMAIEIHHADALRREHGHVAVAKEKNAARVREDGGNIAGDEIFMFAEAHDNGRADARGDDLVRVARRKNRQGVDAAQQLDGLAHGLFERGAIRVFLDQVGDDFRVGFGDELVAFGGQRVLQLDVILDDAVVHDDDFAGAIAVRVGVFFGGAAMRGPARVADAVDAVEGSGANRFFQIVQFAGRAADLQFPVLADHGDAGGVVAAIFEAPEPVQNQRDTFFGPMYPTIPHIEVSSPAPPGGRARRRE